MRNYCNGDKPRVDYWLVVRVGDHYGLKRRTLLLDNTGTTIEDPVPSSLALTLDQARSMLPGGVSLVASDGEDLPGVLEVYIVPGAPRALAEAS